MTANNIPGSRDTVAASGRPPDESPLVRAGFAMPTSVSRLLMKTCWCAADAGHCTEIHFLAVVHNEVEDCNCLLLLRQATTLIGFVFLVVVNGTEHCAVGAELIDSVLGYWRKASSRRVHENDQAHPGISCRVEARRLHSEVASVENASLPTCP